MVESKVRWEDRKIVCELPITLPTSKVRIKRNDEPIAVRQNNLKEDDLLEWQISYYKEGKILIEVGKMLELAYQHGIVTKEELENYKQEYNISWYVAFASDSMAFATLLISLSRDALLKKIKNATDLIKKVASVIIILVGIYLLLEFFVLS